MNWLERQHNSTRAWREPTRRSMVRWCRAGVGLAFAVVVVMAPASGAFAVDRTRPASHGRHVGPNPGRLDYGDVIAWYDPTLPSQAFGFGNPSTDTPLPGDWDGDGRTDAAVFHATTPGMFSFVGSRSGDYRNVQFGQAGDDPTVVGDYDGDGRIDPAVYRPGSPASTWFAALSSGGYLVEQFGTSAYGDEPVPGDYDGDGRADVAVRRVGTNGDYTYFIHGSRAGYFQYSFGRSGDAWVPGDFDGDGRADAVAIRQLENNDFRWFIQLSSGGYKIVDFGKGAYCTYHPFPGINNSWFGDRPHPVGDLDGDGKDDIAVLRVTASTGQWVDYTMLSGGGYGGTSATQGDPVDNLAYGHIAPLTDPCH